MASKSRLRGACRACAYFCTATSKHDWEQTVNADRGRYRSASGLRTPHPSHLNVTVHSLVCMTPPRCLLYAQSKTHPLYILSWLQYSTPQFPIAQFIGLSSRSKWSRALTKSPFLALLAMAGSNAACKISSACSNAVSW
jgi:hypothetical protein